MSDEKILCPHCTEAKRKLESLPPAQREQFKPLVKRCHECERVNGEESVWRK